MTDLAKSLPTYQQCQEWLGGPESGWTMVTTEYKPVPQEWLYSLKGQPSPWLLDADEGFSCLLLHTDGTRVTVRAPEHPMPSTSWEAWFDRIQQRVEHRALGTTYAANVTWQHPQPATDLGERTCVSGAGQSQRRASVHRGSQGALACVTRPAARQETEWQVMRPEDLADEWGADLEIHLPEEFEPSITALVYCARKLREALRWRPVSEPPTEPGRYEVWTDDGPYYSECKMIGGAAVWLIRGTHWRPLPKGPT